MATLRARQVYADGRQTVIIIESVDIRFEKSDSVVGLYARAAPVAVVVSTAGGVRVVDMTEEPAELDRLLDETAGLRNLLKQ